LRRLRDGERFSESPIYKISQLFTGFPVGYYAFLFVCLNSHDLILARWVFRPRVLTFSSRNIVIEKHAHALTTILATVSFHPRAWTKPFRLQG